MQPTNAEVVYEEGACWSALFEYQLLGSEILQGSESARMDLLETFLECVLELIQVTVEIQASFQDADWVTSLNKVSSDQLYHVDLQSLVSVPL